MLHAPPSRSRSGFTLSELLVSFATVIFITTVSSLVFSTGLDSFRQLKGIGDLTEDLRDDSTQLRNDLLRTNTDLAAFISDGLRSGSTDPTDVDELVTRYERIAADADDLEERLRAVERDTVNPVARRLLGRTLAALDRVRVGATRTAGLLKSLDPP